MWSALNKVDYLIFVRESHMISDTQFLFNHIICLFSEIPEIQLKILKYLQERFTENE